MFRLTREVRFAIAPDGSTVTGDNTLAGQPTPVGMGVQLAVQVTLHGELDPQSSYLRNIKDVDAAVRARIVPMLADAVRTRRGDLAVLTRDALAGLKDAFTPAEVETLSLHLSPHLSMQSTAREATMISLSQRFEFSASHRLHNPALGDEANRQLFGKCNNLAGHGHNYEVQVTVTAKPNAQGVVMPVTLMQQIVQTHVIQPMDHKHLNTEVSEFESLNPSVEHIAMVCFDRLKQPMSNANVTMQSVTVWETPRTWAEYRG